MSTNFYLILFFLLINTSLYAQVKIGRNPTIIHPNSILELDSSDKVLVISRMTNTQMNAIQPLKGSLVFNTNYNCVFVFDGTSWMSLCTETGVNVTTAIFPPGTKSIGDFWINYSRNNMASIWDGERWVPIDSNPRRGKGIPSVSTVSNPRAGDVYVDSITGHIYAYDGENWAASIVVPLADNGLRVTADKTVQLGGVLKKPTILQTNAKNTLAITGLKLGVVEEDDIITLTRTTGKLRKISPSNLFREEVAVITAMDGQLRFKPPVPISDSKKVNVFRNGVRIDFTVINMTTIEIEPEAKCYQGDQIRIVQLY